MYLPNFKNKKFINYSTGKEVDAIEHIKNFHKEHPQKDYTIHIGTDSKKTGTRFATFATVISFHFARGVHSIYNKQKKMVIGRKVDFKNMTPQQISVEKEKLDEDMLNGRLSMERTLTFEAAFYLYDNLERLALEWKRGQEWGFVGIDYIEFDYNSIDEPNSKSFRFFEQNLKDTGLYGAKVVYKPDSKNMCAAIFADKICK